jgi:hypothetical protein
MRHYVLLERIAALHFNYRLITLFVLKLLSLLTFSNYVLICEIISHVLIFNDKNNL